MHLEIRKKGSHKANFLSHSLREGSKVRKVRVYLGSDLNQKQLALEKRMAEKRLWDLINAKKSIGDPFEKALSDAELRRLKDLKGFQGLRVMHLSEGDWLKFTEEFTFDTNAIEGSTLEFGEVRQILEKDKWPQKPKEDISEAYGVARAIELIRKTKEEVSFNLILDIHKTVFENSKTFAGHFRNKGEEVAVHDFRGNVVHRGAPSNQVKPLLRALVEWYEKNKRRYHPLVVASVVHNQFENIHPFRDGNGRVGRLLLNNVLLKNGLPPINIELRSRQEYYASLRAYQKDHNLRPTVELMLKEYAALGRLLKK